jgi:hypothetical protein
MLLLETVVAVPKAEVADCPAGVIFASASTVRLPTALVADNPVTLILLLETVVAVPKAEVPT